MSENLGDTGTSLLDDAVKAASAVPEALLETAAAAAAEFVDLEVDEVAEKVTSGAKKAHKKSKMLIMTLLVAGAAVGGYLAWTKHQEAAEAESDEVDSSDAGDSGAEESSDESQTPDAEQADEATAEGGDSEESDESKE